VGERRLSDGEKRDYAERGWLVVDDLLGDALPELQDEVARVEAWGEDGEWLQHFELTDAGRRLARTENFTPFSALLASVLRDGAIPAVAGQLLGEPALLYKEKINYKAVGGAGFSPHQDKPAYPLVDQVLSAMIAIDDATIDNGCLYVVDGHHHGLLAQDDRGCIASAVVEGLDWHAAELRAGQSLFFSALTPHRSAANRSSKTRRALFPTYNGASEGDLREAYYEQKRQAFASPETGDRARLSLIGDFEGRPA